MQSVQRGYTLVLGRSCCFFCNLQGSVVLLLHAVRRNTSYKPRTAAKVQKLEASVM